MEAIKDCPEQQVNVIGYVRVSTMAQVDSGLGLQVQREQIESECMKRGWCLQAMATDRGRSAKTMSRTGIQAAIASLHAGEAGVLMVSKQDRASRNVSDVIQLIEEAARGRWKLVDLELNIDTTTATGEAMALQRAVFSQWERRIISERTRDALRVKKAQGVTLGRPDRTPAVAKARIAELQKAGLSVAKIVDVLNAEGVTTATGLTWHITGVHRVIARQRKA